MIPEGDISFEKSKLKIKGEYYTPPIQPPKPEAILDLSVPRLEEVMKTPMVNGTTYQKHNNRFIGYTVKVSDLQQVKDAYLKMRIAHPRARHIVCAYALENVENFEAKNFCDDGEVSAGRVLLGLLEKLDLYGRAIFVVRYFGDNRIGPDRYNLMEAAALSALKQSLPGQELNPKEYPSRQQPQQPSTEYPPLPQRNFQGRGYGRRQRANYRGALLSTSKMRRGGQNSTGYRGRARGYTPRGRGYQAYRGRQNNYQDTKRKRVESSPHATSPFKFAAPDHVSGNELNSCATSTVQTEDEMDQADPINTSQDDSDYPDDQAAIEDWSQENTGAFENDAN